MLESKNLGFRFWIILKNCSIYIGDSIWIRFALEKQIDDESVALLSSLMKRRVAGSGAAVNAGACSEKEPDHGDLTKMGRDVQRCVAGLCPKKQAKKFQIDVK